MGYSGIAELLYEVVGTAATAAAGAGIATAIAPKAPKMNVPPPPGAALIDPSGSAAAAQTRQRQAAAGGLNSTQTGAGATAGSTGGVTGGSKSLLGQ